MDERRLAERPLMLGTGEADRRADLAAILATLVRWAQVLSRRPDLLWQQVRNELGPEAAPGSSLAELLEGAERDRAVRGEPWLLLERPGPAARDALVYAVDAHVGQGQLLEHEARFCGWASALSAIVTAGTDGMLRAWAPQTGAPLWELRVGSDALLCGEVDPDGEHVAIGSQDGTVHLVDLTGRRVLATAEVGLRAVEACTLTRELLVAVVRPGTLVALQVGSDRLEEIWHLRDPGDALSCTSLGADGPIAVGCASGQLVLVDARSGSTVRVLGPASSAIRTIVGHAGAVTLGRDDGTVELVDVASGATHATWHLGSAVRAICHLADGRIAAGGDGGRVQLVGPFDTDEVAEVGGHTGWIRAVGYSPDTAIVFSVGADGALRAFDPTWSGGTRTPLPSEPSLGSAIWSAVAPDGRTAAIARLGGLEILDLASGEPRRLIPVPETVTTSCAFDGSGRLYTAGQDGWVRLWEPSTGARLGTLDAGGGGLTSVDVSHDGGLVAAATMAGRIIFWRAGAGEGIRLAVSGGPIWCCRIAPDRRLLAAAGHDGSLSMWELEGLSCVTRIRANDSEAYACAFDGTGGLVAVAGADGRARVWRLGRSEPVLVTPNLGSVIRGCALSRSGDVLATAAWDKTLRLWQVSTGREIACLPTDASLMSCAFGADDTIVAGDDWSQAAYVAGLKDWRVA